MGRKKHTYIHTYIHGIYLIERGWGEGNHVEKEERKKTKKNKSCGSNRESLIELKMMLMIASLIEETHYIV